MSSTTIKDLEDLLVAKIAALEDPAHVKYFNTVDTLSEKEFRHEAITSFPGAIISFASDRNTGVRSRLVVDEIYDVAVISKKTGSDASGSHYALCDVVQNGIHGKDWGEANIEPFQYTGRELINKDGETLTTVMKFSVRHIKHVPATT